jgi:hypothetical protein
VARGMLPRLRSEADKVRSAVTLLSSTSEARACRFETLGTSRELARSRLISDDHEYASLWKNTNKTVTANPIVPMPLQRCCRRRHATLRGARRRQALLASGFIQAVGSAVDNASG